VKIAEGCDHTCAFCIIPKLRGVFRSRSPESILREVEMLAAQGVKEFVLISQDTTNYGTDLALKDGLARLVDSIAVVDGVQWVALPLLLTRTAITNELLDVMARRDNVCNYFDIPLQHASRNVLGRMRRGGNREAYERNDCPHSRARADVAIRTTFIVGFPGERDEDSTSCWTSLRSVKFDRVGVFTYSDEENSAAFELDEKVDPADC